MNLHQNILCKQFSFSFRFEEDKKQQYLVKNELIEVFEIAVT
jgi:hypothetical protein